MTDKEQLKIQISSRRMTPDKELWDKRVWNEKYEFIPIPTEVAKILVRKKDDKVLLAHFVKENGENTILMHYVKDEGSYLSQHGGYCTSTYIDVKSALICLAKQIAEDWPQYAVKHRKRK